MKSVTFTFDEVPNCPHCSKPLDDCPARDFIVFLPGNIPTTDVCKDRCGWCDGEFEAQRTDVDEITFKAIN